MPLPIWTGRLVSTIEAKELSLFMSNETGKPIQRRQTLSATLGQYKKEQIKIFPLYLYIFDILFHYRNIEFEIFISSQCNGKCNQTCLLIAIIGSTFSTGDFCKHIHTKIYCFLRLLDPHSFFAQWMESSCVDLSSARNQSTTVLIDSVSGAFVTFNDSHWLEKLNVVQSD